MYISIHAPAKGATKYGAKGEKRQKFQSTLPRRERRQLQHNCVGGYFISIHAPAKGATSETALEQIMQDISIHAPAKGATPVA